VNWLGLIRSWSAMSLRPPCTSFRPNLVSNRGPARAVFLLRVSLFLLCVLGSSVLAADLGGPAIPSLKTIVEGIALARSNNEAQFRSYVVTRQYTLYGKNRATSKSQVTADVAFTPPHAKQYVIAKSSGAGIGEKIVRRMLDGEAGITKDSATTFSLENYDFVFMREETFMGHRCYVLAIVPKRKDKNLIRGTIWVDANTYLLHRAEGEPAKSPSWWLRQARIVFSYGNVQGMWLQTGSESSANVRMLGHHTMVSRDVEYKIAEAAVSGHRAAEQAAGSPRPR
jgi:hypothetical protein